MQEDFMKVEKLFRSFTIWKMSKEYQMNLELGGSSVELLAKANKILDDQLILDDFFERG